MICGHNRPYKPINGQTTPVYDSDISAKSLNKYLTDHCLWYFIIYSVNVHAQSQPFII